MVGTPILFPVVFNISSVNLLQDFRRLEYMYSLLGALHIFNLIFFYPGFGILLLIISVLCVLRSQMFYFRLD